MTAFNWKDFEMIATWMAEEIAGNYTMDKKSYNNQPYPTPYYFIYRKPVFLVREERTILALFIRYIFLTFVKTGKEDDFDSMAILRRILRQTGLMGNYDETSRLHILCRCFVDIFPSFVHFCRDRGILFNVAF